MVKPKHKPCALIGRIPHRKAAVAALFKKTKGFLATGAAANRDLRLAPTAASTRVLIGRFERTRASALDFFYKLKLKLSQLMILSLNEGMKTRSLSFILTVGACSFTLLHSASPSAGEVLKLKAGTIRLQDTSPELFKLGLQKMPSPRLASTANFLWFNLIRPFLARIAKRSNLITQPFAGIFR